MKIKISTLLISFLFFSLLFVFKSWAQQTPAPTAENTLQLKTFKPLTPTPTSVPTAAPIAQPKKPIPITQLKIGGENGVDYCIDDVDPDRCDDQSAHLVPKGSGGVSGPCGTVISQVHNIIPKLPQDIKATRDSLSGTISNCGYSTGPASGYVSTHMVIDAYNLAGFTELSKNNPSHVSPSGLYSWWQSAPGYRFIPYSPSVILQFASGQIDLTGCAMFLSTGGSYHIGIVNKFEVLTPGGDGVLSILQSGTRMWIDRFPVASGNVSNSSTNQTVTSGAAGFGCH